MSRLAAAAGHSGLSEVQRRARVPRGRVGARLSLRAGFGTRSATAFRSCSSMRRRRSSVVRRAVRRVASYSSALAERARAQSGNARSKARNEFLLPDRRTVDRDGADGRRVGDRLGRALVESRAHRRADRD